MAKQIPPPPNSMQPMNEADIRELRKIAVAKYLIRGWSLRKIALQLPKENPPILNTDGQPFSFATVNLDAVAIRQQWRSARDKDMQAVMSHELAKLAEIETSAWEQTPPDFRAILMAMAQRAKLLGLDFDTREALRNVVTLTPETQRAMSDMQMTLEQATTLFNQFMVRLAQRQSLYESEASEDQPLLLDE